MKKLTILSVVAALAAFGWAGVANADDTDDQTGVSVTCVDAGVGGVATDDELDIAFDFVGPGRTAIEVRCAGHHRDKVTTTEIILDCEFWGAGGGCDDELTSYTHPIDQLNGFNSLRPGDECKVVVKGLHDPGTRNKGHETDMATCDL